LVRFDPRYGDFPTAFDYWLAVRANQLLHMGFFVMSAAYDPNKLGWGAAAATCALTAALGFTAYTIHKNTYLHPRDPMAVQVYNQRDAAAKEHTPAAGEEHAAPAGESAKADSAGGAATESAPAAAKH